MSRASLISALVLVAALFPGRARADLYPPFQFRIMDPKGSVKLQKPNQAAQMVDSRAQPGKGDIITTGKDGGATIRVASFGALYVLKGTKLIVSDVKEGGKPFFDLVDGGVLVKSRPKGGLEPLTVSFGGSFIGVREGAAEIRYKESKKAALLSVVEGSVDLTTPATNKTLKKSSSLIRGDGKTRTKAEVDVKEIAGRWSYLGDGVMKPEVPDIRDEVPPAIQMLAPPPGATHPTGQIEVYGTVDDPTVTQVQIKIDGAHQSYSRVVDGQFRTSVPLRKASQTIQVVATDESGNQGTGSVVAKSSAPAAPLTDPEPEEPPTFLQRAVATLKNPGEDPQFFATLAGGILVFIVVIFLAIGKAMGMAKKGAEKAAGLATGVMFHRCEKCGDREYEYHLFYTTEPVTSAFMRNLINNVNPMATSIMNESLENLLNTGLMGTQGAKAAEQKIRVTCTWCDACKVGNLKLEHMKSEETVKTDDYQIIHPIFIEWVRKVYD